MRRDWTYRPNEKFGTDDAISLGYDNTLFPFCVLFAAIVAAAVLVALERSRLFEKSLNLVEASKRRKSRAKSLPPPSTASTAWPEEDTRGPTFYDGDALNQKLFAFDLLFNGRDADLHNNGKKLRSTNSR